jgi:hypothetical protein
VSERGNTEPYILPEKTSNFAMHGMSAIWSMGRRLVRTCRAVTWYESPFGSRKIPVLHKYVDEPLTSLEVPWSRKEYRSRVPSEFPTYTSLPRQHSDVGSSIYLYCSPRACTQRTCTCTGGALTGAFPIAEPDTRANKSSGLLTVGVGGSLSFEN